MSGDFTLPLKSSEQFPIYFLEPTNELMRKHIINSRLRKREEDRYQHIELEEFKKKLKSIREENVRDMEKNVEKIQILLKEKGIKSYYAENTKDAARYIKDTLNKSKISTICINNSSVVREVIPEIDDDLEIMDTYNPKSREIENTDSLKYWELPELVEESLWNSFDIIESKYKDKYGFANLFGVNAISSEDGSIFFVQHFDNISEFLKSAKKTILVIGIEKIVKDREQALFISKSAALFGLKSIILGILSKGTKFQKISIDEAKAKFKKDEELGVSNIHVIILDNGRKELLKSEFEEFLHCINCRACGSVCPRSLLTKEEEFITPRELIYLRITKGLKETVDHGLYNCSLCGGCKIACPLSIPLPDFLKNIRAQVVEESLVPKKHLTLGKNVKIFGNPYGKGDQPDKK